MHIHLSLLPDNQDDYQRHLFLLQKIKEHAEDLIAVIVIADIYDTNHSENSEAQGGHTFTLFK